jgi:hypothetical protein
MYTHVLLTVKKHCLTPIHLLAALLPCLLPCCPACLQVDGDGRVLDFLTDPTGRHVAAVSAVTEHVTQDHSGSGSRRRLFLGNLVGDYVSYVDLGPAGSADADDDDAQGQEEL